jgi:hypothetical protein
MSSGVRQSQNAPVGGCSMRAMKPSTRTRFPASCSTRAEGRRSPCFSNNSPKESCVAAAARTRAITVAGF